jgi:C1A family cysteine protease
VYAPATLSAWQSVGGCAHGFAWRPDVADHRDYTLDHDRVQAIFAQLAQQSRRPAKLPPHVDHRLYSGNVEEQRWLTASPAQACAALVQHCERRASGQLLAVSRLFIEQTARRLSSDGPLSLRTAFKVCVRFGVPPEALWPLEKTLASREPAAFTYSFQRECRNLRYVRLDGRSTAGAEVLQRVKAFLAAGFPVAFGFALASSIGDAPEISYPTASDAILGGHAVLAVGYDDQLRIRSDKGALLVRNSWGREWGDEGYGWLPYAYVRARLASDFWTAFKPSWLRSGEFTLPAQWS